VSYPVFDTYDDVRGVALRPGKRGWYRKESTAYLEINSLGYLDAEHAREKSDGVIRIAFLGDSFTEARQVPLADGFCKQVERRLNADVRLRGVRVESLCFGVGGYGTAEELLTLRMHVLQFAPDVVVLAMFTANDIADNSRRIANADGALARPFYVRRDGQLVLDDSFRDLTVAHLQRRVMLTAVHYSRLLEVANQWRRDREMRARQARHSRPAMLLGTYDEIYAAPADEVWADAWSITEDLLGQMQADVVQAGARFVLVTVSTTAQVDPDAERRARLQAQLGVADLFYSERRLRGVGQHRGFTVITLGEPMQAEADRRKVYFHGFENGDLGHGHWNVEGHAIAARIIADELLSQAIVASPSVPSHPTEPALPNRDGSQRHGMP
jgi:hypothetical protein